MLSLFITTFQYDVPGKIASEQKNEARHKRGKLKNSLERNWPNISAPAAMLPRVPSLSEMNFLWFWFIFGIFTSVSLINQHKLHQDKGSYWGPGHLSDKPGSSLKSFLIPVGTHDISLVICQRKMVNSQDRPRSSLKNWERSSLMRRVWMKCADGRKRNGRLKHNKGNSRYRAVGAASAAQRARFMWDGNRDANLQ